MEVYKKTQAIAPFDAAMAMEVLPDAVLALDDAGSVIFSNPAAQEFFRGSAAALLAKNIAALIGAAHPVLAALTGGTRAVLHDIDVNGARISVSVTMLDNGGALLVFRRDGLNLRRDWFDKMRRHIKPAQHLARLLAHEIKNPLSGIRGAAQLLMRSNLREDDAELARLIDDETQRLFRLIEKVNVFDDSAAKFAPVNLHDVLDHVVKVSGFGGKFELQYDPSLPDIAGDRDRLVQAFLNILRNAAEAGAKSIVLRSYYAASPGLHPETHARLPICIDIADDGAGMSEETRSHLFEPYFTTKSHGQGLGLAIVAKIIDDHGGAIEVAGATVFKFSFPRSVT